MTWARGRGWGRRFSICNSLLIFTPQLTSKQKVVSFLFAEHHLCRNWKLVHSVVDEVLEFLRQGWLSLNLPLYSDMGTKSWGAWWTAHRRLSLFPHPALFLSPQHSFLPLPGSPIILFRRKDKLWKFLANINKQRRGQNFANIPFPQRKFLSNAKNRTSLTLVPAH